LEQALDDTSAKQQAVAEANQRCELLQQQIDEHQAARQQLALSSDKDFQLLQVEFKKTSIALDAASAQVQDLQKQTLNLEQLKMHQVYCEMNQSTRSYYFVFFSQEQTIKQLTFTRDCNEEELADLNDRNAEIERELAATKAQVAEKTAHVGQLEHLVSEQRMRLHESSAESKDVSEQFTEAAGRIAGLLEILEQTKQALAKVEQDKVLLAQHNETLVQQLEKTQQELDASAADSDTIHQQLIAVQDATLVQLKQAQAGVLELSNKYNYEHEQCMQAQKLLDTSKAELERALVQQQTLSVQLDECKQMLADLEQKSSFQSQSIVSKDETIASLTAELGSSKDQLAHTLSKTEQTAQALAANQDQLHEIQFQLSAAKDANLQLNAQLEAVQSQQTESDASAEQIAVQLNQTALHLQQSQQDLAARDLEVQRLRESITSIKADYEAQLVL